MICSACGLQFDVLCEAESRCVSCCECELLEDDDDDDEGDDDDAESDLESSSHR